MAEYLVLTLDVADPDVQTAFWCGALGYQHTGGVGHYRIGRAGSDQWLDDSRIRG